MFEIRVEDPLTPGFWWLNGQGQEKWAQLRYERLSDFCYGCGYLGHTSNSCNKEITLSETNIGKPMFGPWITSERQRNKNHWSRLGGGANTSKQTRYPKKESWKDLMREGGSSSHQQEEMKPKVEDLGHNLG